MDPHVKCLNIYPLGNWEKHVASVKAGLNLNDREQRYLLDIFYSNFKIIVVPDSGRINLPNNFLKEVNITKEVVFVGRGACIGCGISKSTGFYIGTGTKVQRMVTCGKNI
jgi:DNA-binding transcriptional regulator/RsmH inhibitor MraZ